MNKLVEKIVGGEHIFPVLPDNIKNYLIDKKTIVQVFKD